LNVIQTTPRIVFSSYANNWSKILFADCANSSLKVRPCSQPGCEPSCVTFAWIDNEKIWPATNVSRNCTPLRTGSGSISLRLPRSMLRVKRRVPYNTISALATGWSTTEPDIFDVNGDGPGGVLIGAPNAASGSICGGAAYLYLSAGLGSPLATRLMLTAPVLDPSGQTSFQAFGWATAFAGSGSRLFFVSDHGLELGTTANAGQVYVFKVN
jgi:hypothetical protein